MLRNLVERYLDNIENERAFDGTFLALLSADGYEDIHFLHGVLEFGKDFIAKKSEAGIRRQYAFQNKSGNLAISGWRDTKQQILDAITNSIAHPSFDATLHRRVVLVLTGRLAGTAPADFQEFARFVRTNFGSYEVEIWDRESIIELMLKHGPAQLFRSSRDVRAYGAFYSLYGDILERTAKVDDIEKHFEDRLKADATPEERLAVTSVEAHLFADAARSTKQHYLALQSFLAIVRAVLYEMQCGDDSLVERIRDLLDASCAAVAQQASTTARYYLAAANNAGSLMAAMNGAGMFVSYPVLCAQLMDALVLVHTFGADEEMCEAAAALCQTVANEPGCAHPISDRYAVSVVAAARMLRGIGQAEDAKFLVKGAAIWLVDRYWNEENGLAPCDASEAEEIRQLLGGPFIGVDVSRDSGSLLACALMDAACLLQDSEVYRGLRADILAADIVPRYYQVQDTPGQFEYAAEDLVRFPNVEFAETMPAFEDLTHGEHLMGEPRSFRLQTKVPKGVYTAISLLMRDRYFPTTWTASTNSHIGQ